MPENDRQPPERSTPDRFVRRVTVADALMALALVTIVSSWWLTRSDDRPSMPRKLVDSAERELYLQPGGRYTESDIAANGGVTASDKFAGFRARHDFDPQPGDRICPVTRTKADPSCAWVIGGRRYTFCCPPCIDEFLEAAKQTPDRIRPPEAYTKQPSTQ